MEDDEEPQHGAEGEVVALDTPRARTRRTSSGQAPHRSTAASSQELGDSSQARANLVVPLSSAPPATSTLVVSAPIGQPQAPLATSSAAPTHPMTAYPLYHVPEDQTGAAKEAMI